SCAIWRRNTCHSTGWRSRAAILHPYFCTLQSPHRGAQTFLSETELAQAWQSTVNALSQPAIYKSCTRIARQYTEQKCHSKANERRVSDKNVRAPVGRKPQSSSTTKIGVILQLA